MRLYTFNNMYLSPLQCGLQTAHVVAEMSVRYYAAMDGGDDTGEAFYSWAMHHKTMILLNGGYSSTLKELYEFFQQTENPYPFEKFHESEEALDGALTCVGIVLPEKIYGLSALMRENGMEFQLARKESDCTPWEMELVERLTKFGLA